MSEANVSNAESYPYIEKLEVTRWMAFTLWVGFFIVGVPGNLLILAVYWAKGVKTSTHVFIGSLAMADLLTCVLKFADAIAIASVSHYLEYNRQSAVYFLSVGLLYTSALLTTFIAIDRFDAVCRSLRRKMTLRRAKIVAVACYAVSFIVTVPEVAQKMEEDSVQIVDTFKRSVVKFIPVILYITSLFVVIVMYCGIFVFLRKRAKTEARDIPTVSRGDDGHAASSSHVTSDPSRRGRAHLSQAGTVRVIHVNERPCSTEPQQPPQQIQGEGTADTHDLQPRDRGRQPHRPNLAQTRVTKMLFIATFLFFILWFPNICLKFYALYGNLFSDFLKSHHYANLISAFLVLRDIAFFNSVINAFIYGIANKRFLFESKMVLRNLRLRFG